MRNSVASDLSLQSPKKDARLIWVNHLTELFHGHAYPSKNNLVDGIGLTEIES